MKSVVEMGLRQVTKHSWQLCVLAVFVLGLALSNAKAYYQNPWTQKDLEIARLEARIAELESQRVACFKFRRDPALNRPVWAEGAE